MPIEPLAAALVFAAIFIAGGALHARSSPRTAISIGAGVSTAYVFVHMLPELNEAGRVFVAATAQANLPAPELRVYVAALTGFVVFYGLENLVRWSHERAAGSVEAETAGPVFWLHVGGFAVYVALVAYLMVRGITEKALPIALYTVAMGLHFLGVDRSLRREHGALYDHAGRFVLAAAALAGFAVGVRIEFAHPIVITVLALVSGGVVVNSTVMELPDEKEGRFWPFVAGAAGYTGLLAIVH
jgi:hypothetical protein